MTIECLRGMQPHEMPGVDITATYRPRLCNGSLRTKGEMVEPTATSSNSFGTAFTKAAHNRADTNSDFANLHYAEQVDELGALFDTLVSWETQLSEVEFDWEELRR